MEHEQLEPSWRCEPRCQATAVCLSVAFFQGGSANSNPSFGWNVYAPVAAPSMPMPQPPPSPRNSERYQKSQSDDPGVEEVFQAKDAGAESFAHFIVKWVSWVVFIVFWFPWFTMLAGWLSLLIHFLALRSLTRSHIHRSAEACNVDFHATTMPGIFQALLASLSWLALKVLTRKTQNIFIISHRFSAQSGRTSMFGLRCEVKF